MKELKRRWLNFLISFDQFIYSIITLGNAAPDETMSAGAYRLEQQNRWQGKVFRPFIDWLFTYIQTEHCKKAYYAEVTGTQRNL
jgi:hypothetical protein